VKIRWLNKECTNAEITVGWFKKRVAYVEWRAFTAPSGKGWFYVGTDTFLSDPTSAGRNLAGQLDLERMAQLGAQEAEQNWTWVQGSAKPAKLPRVKMLKPHPRPL
jgi:hypothetical protein